MDLPLTPSEVAALLEAAMATLSAELGALPERVVAWHPAAGGWGAKEVGGPPIEAQRRGFAGRSRLIPGADRPAPPSSAHNEAAPPAFVKPRLRSTHASHRPQAAPSGVGS